MKKQALYYNHFCEYDPSTDRYTQSDPIGLNGGVNTYAYNRLPNQFSSAEDAGEAVEYLMGESSNATVKEFSDGKRYYWDDETGLFGARHADNNGTIFHPGTGKGYFDKQVNDYKPSKK